MFVADADLNRCGGYYYYIIVIVISLHSDEKLIIVNKTYIHTYIHYQKCLPHFGQNIHKNNYVGIFMHNKNAPLWKKYPYSGHSDKRNCSESQGASKLKYAQLASLGGILQIDSRNQPFLEKRSLLMYVT